MELAVLAARLILIGVFLVSGGAKLIDRAGSRESLRAFGIAERFVPSLVVGLPLFELALAGLLVIDGTARLGAWGALTLLTAFTAMLGWTLYRGRNPVCHCFGQLSTAPISRRTIARNLGFIAAALLVIGAGPGSLAAPLNELSMMSGRVTAVLVLGLGVLIVVAAAQGWLIGQLLKQQGRLLTRLERIEQRIALEAPPLPGAPDAPVVAAGLPLGAPAPPFQLQSVAGTPQLLPPVALQPRATLLVFVDPDCGPCHALLPQVEEWRQAYAELMQIAVISRGTAEVNQAKFQHHPHGRYLLQRDREVAAAYRVEVTPSAVVVKPDGTIGSSVHAGAEAIRRLVDQEVQVWTKPVLTH